MKGHLVMKGHLWRPRKLACEGRIGRHGLGAPKVTRSWRGGKPPRNPPNVARPMRDGRRGREGPWRRLATSPAARSPGRATCVRLAHTLLVELCFLRFLCDKFRRFLVPVSQGGLPVLLDNSTQPN